MNRESLLGPLKRKGAFALPPFDPSHFRAMTAVALQPVVVNSPTEVPTADCPIYLDADSPVVSATLFLGWQQAPVGPGGRARMQLMASRAMIAFFPRCFISRGIVDQTAAHAVNALSARLTDSAWSRILTELLSAQVFARPANSLNELHASMGDACFPTPARLGIAADDWRHMVASAVPAETDTASVAAHQQLEPIRSLGLVNALDVEVPMASLPLGLFSAIVALAGSYRTQAVQELEAPSVLLASVFHAHLTSTVRMEAQLAAEVASFIGGGMLLHQARGLGKSGAKCCKDLGGGSLHLDSGGDGRSFEGGRIQPLGVGLSAAATLPCDGLQADAACRGPDLSAHAFEKTHLHMLPDRCATCFNPVLHPLHAAAALPFRRAWAGTGRGSPHRSHCVPAARALRRPTFALQACGGGTWAARSPRLCTRTQSGPRPMNL